MTESLEFVNDWSELESALMILADSAHFGQRDDNDLGEWDCSGQHVSEDVLWAIMIVETYVPRLLTQYANLVELSFALTEGWETYAALNAPTGLYLPDNR